MSLHDLTRHDRALAALVARGQIVKIDGLREPAHAAAAASAGADLIGFIFAPARRQVSAATARNCIFAAREAAGRRQIFSVGVFVDAEVQEMRQVIAEAGLDAVQLHGDEPPESLSLLGVLAIKAFRPRPGATVEQTVQAIERYDVGKRPAAAALLDAFVEGAAGGTGARADWELAAGVSRMRPVLLAGGLDADNVGEAIRRVFPLGVDVSSGVETGGQKDPVKIAAFVAAAREAFAG